MRARNELSWRQVQALIRHGVRRRLDSFRGQDIWKTAFFINRIDLSAEAFDYQTVRKPSGELVQVDELLKVVRDEFRDFILVEDVNNTIDLSETSELECNACRNRYVLAHYTACPSCGYSNIFQKTELELIALAEKVDPQVDDPLVSRAYDGMANWTIDTAYKELVSHFEFFMKRLDSELFARGSQAAELVGHQPSFQSLRNAEDHFREVYGLEVFRPLSDSDRHRLRSVFNKRHVLTHHGGFIDEDYVRRMQIDEEKIGERVDTSKSEVLQAIDSVQDVVDALRDKVELRVD